MKFATRVIFLLAATLVLAGFAIGFTAHIEHWHWAVEFGTAWFTMAWAAGLYAVRPFHLPESCYGLRKFETKGDVYRVLGIKYFQKFVMWRLIHVLAPGHEYSGRKNLPKLENETRKAETIHALAFVLLFLPVGYALSRRWYASASWLMFLNVVFNIYPILLQRYNRARLIRLLNRR